MNEYVNLKGVLLDRYEWHIGYDIRDPFVGKSQTGRRKDIKAGIAKEVDPSVFEAEIKPTLTHIKGIKRAR
jgi:hypothetical protein